MDWLGFALARLLIDQLSQTWGIGETSVIGRKEAGADGRAAFVPMGNPSRRVAAAVTLIGGYANLAIAIISGVALVPLYLRHIGAEVYGTWLSTGAIVGWLAFLDLGVSAFTIQKIAIEAGRNQHDKAASYYVTSLYVYAALAGVLLILGVAASWIAPRICKVTPDAAPALVGCLMLAVVSLACNLMNSAVTSLHEAYQLPLFMNCAGVACSVFGLVVTVALLFDGWGLWAIAHGMWARGVPLVIANAYYSRKILQTRGLRGRAERELFRELLQVAPSVLLSRGGISLSASAEPFVINAFFSPEIVTSFCVSRRAAELIKMLLDKISGSIFAGFCHAVAHEDNKVAGAILRKVMRLMLMGCVMLFGGVVALNHAFIRLWVGEQFCLGDSFSLVVALAFAVACVGSLLSYLMGACGEIRSTHILLFLESVIKIPLMVLSVWLWGWWGAPFSAVFVSGCFCWINWMRMSRRLPGSLLFADIGAKVLAAVFGVSVLFFGAVKVYEVDSWAKFFAAIFFYCASAGAAAAMVDGTVKKWFTGISSLGLAWVRTPFHR